MKSKVLARRVLGVPLAIASILTTIYLSHLWIDNTKDLKLLLNQRPEIEEPVLKEGTPSPESPNENDSEDEVNTEEQETQEETPTPPEEKELEEEESKEEEKQEDEKEEDTKKDEQTPEEQDTDLPSIDNDLSYISNPGKIDILKYIKRKIQETNKYGYSWASTLPKLLSTWKVKNTTTSLIVVLKEFDAMLKKASQQPKPSPEEKVT